jgi:RND family efflux transporter MFP subunit
MLAGIRWMPPSTGKGYPIPGVSLVGFTPFDPATKIAEALIVDASGSEQRIIKGAPAVVAGSAPFGPMAAIELDTLTQQGYRVLAVASGAPQQVKIIGLIGLSDPPRPDSKELLTELRSMGVHTVMVTGDAAATAATVAAAIGLEGPVCPPGAIPDSVGPEDFAVYAGVFPEDKFRLVKAFQRKGHTVGMCGDGVNDAPALRQAQMGIAVSTATDVAKSAASMVLTEPGLEGIVTAIKEGRSAFQRILTYTLNALAKKFQLVLFLGAGLIMTGHAVLTPMLMALLLITGDFITMSLTTDRATPSPMPDAWQVHNITAAAAILGLLDLTFAVGVIAVGKNRLGLSVEELRTLAFVTIVFTSQATVYVVRERGRMWHSRPGGWLVLSSFLDLGIAIPLAITGVLMRPLSAWVVANVFAAAIAFSFALDAVKFVAFKRLKLVQEGASYEHAVSPRGREIQWPETKREGAIGRGEARFGSKTDWRMVTGAILVLAFGSGWLYWSLYGGGAVRYLTQKVERGSVVRTVNASGVVNPTATAPVGAHASGVIQVLYCGSNMKVAKGQLCAKIDPRPYQLAVDREKVNIVDAEARLEKDKAILFERNRGRAKRRAISRAVLDESRNAYERAQAQTKVDETVIAAHRTALHGAEINLDYTDIVSPANGIVVSRTAEVGQTVAADSETPLFVIASDITVMRVDVKVGENDIGKMKLGNKATFTVGSFPNRRFAGEVTQIGQRPQMIQTVVTYDVVINAPNLDLLLEPGMAAATSIVVGRRDNVLRVPDQALRFSPDGRAPLTGAAGPSTLPDGSSRLWILRDGKASAITVQLGLDDGAYTEIVKGDLRPGDELIVGESDGHQMMRTP